MPLWNEIEGKTLNGLPLRTLLRSEGRTAWFATEDGGQPAVLSLFEALNDEDAVEGRLKVAARLQHPNLLAIRSVGRGRLDDESLVYAVMEPFDQTLGEILTNRTLTPEEAREVADSLLRGLEAVEGAGLSHGHVDASGVLGVGDSIKLRSDCLRPRTGQSSDAPALASLIYSAMTGRRLSSERDAVQLPALFATVVRAGAGVNGSLTAMRRALDGPTSTSVPAPVPAAAPAAPPAKPPASAPVPRRPILDTAPAVRPRHRGITIAAIVIMAIVLGILWHSLKGRPTGRTPIVGEAPATSAPSAPQKPAITPGVGHAAAPAGNAGAGNVHSPQPATATPAATVSHEGGERSQWRVIVYTYNQQDTAQHKASELAAKFPQFQPQVFTPTGQAPYLVSLGGSMSRHDAFMRREAAKSAGLPPDTYMQNYRQ